MGRKQIVQVCHQFGKKKKLQIPLRVLNILRLFLDHALFPLVETGGGNEVLVSEFFVMTSESGCV